MGLASEASDVSVTPSDSGLTNEQKKKFAQGKIYSDPYSQSSWMPTSQNTTNQSRHQALRQYGSEGYQNISQSQADKNSELLQSIQSEEVARQARLYGSPQILDTNQLRRDTSAQQEQYDALGNRALNWDPGSADYGKAQANDAQQALSLYGAKNALNQSGQFRDAQMGNIDYLRQMQAGQTPSVAQLQLQAGADKSVAAMNATAAGARGGNIAGAQYQAQTQGADTMTALNQQQAILRAQEQQAATGMLADATSAGRLGDAQLASGYRDIGAQYGDAAQAQAGRAQYDVDQQMRAESQRTAAAGQWYNMANSQRDAEYAARANAEQQRLASVQEWERLKQKVAGSSLAPALIQGGATVVGGLIGSYAGPVGTTTGAGLGAAAWKAATS